MLLGFGKSLDPNRIDSIPVPDYAGCMGLVACPGTRLHQPEITAKKVLPIDLEGIVEWGGNGLVCLLEPHELTMHGIEQLGEETESRGLWFKHLPIPDMGVPDQNFEDIWAVEGERIRHALRIGERVIFHCYAGQEEAIKFVRSTNRRRIQTKGQSNYVRRCYSLVDDSH